MDEVGIEQLNELFILHSDLMRRHEETRERHSFGERERVDNRGQFLKVLMKVYALDGVPALGMHLASRGTYRQIDITRFQRVFTPSSTYHPAISSMPLREGIGFFPSNST